MRATHLLLGLALVACKGNDDTDNSGVSCTSEGLTPLPQVSAPEWPAGLADRLTQLRALDGLWSATACGSPITVSIRVPEVLDNIVDIVTTPLPAGHACGCSHDPAFPADGSMNVIAHAEIDLSFTDYPEEGFREEAAGNVPDLDVWMYAEGAALEMRGCKTQLIPPVLLLEHRDTEITFRVDSDGPSAFINLTNADSLADASCEVTGWQRVGNN